MCTLYFVYICIFSSLIKKIIDIHSVKKSLENLIKIYIRSVINVPHVVTLKLEHKICRRMKISLLTLLGGFLKGSKEGGERLRGCAGGGRRAEGVRGLRCDVTSYLGGHLGLSRRTCGARGLRYRPDAALHIFQGKLEIV